MTRALLACGMIAGPLFIAVFLIAGATRADYDPLRHHISTLAIGDLGWIQQANFLVTGALVAAYAIGLREVLKARGGSRSAPVLVALFGIGLLGSGIFVADPGLGYPPGTPFVPEEPTTSGGLHNLFSLVAFVALPAACFVLGRRFLSRGQRDWGWYSIGAGVAFIVFFVLTIAGDQPAGPLTDLAGLLQRIMIAIAFIWLTSLAVHQLRSST